MSYHQETYKERIVRKLIELVGCHGDQLTAEERDAINYVIGYLIGIGWREV